MGAWIDRSDRGLGHAQGGSFIIIVTRTPFYFYVSFLSSPRFFATVIMGASKIYFTYIYLFFLVMIVSSGRKIR